MITYIRNHMRLVYCCYSLAGTESLQYNLLWYLLKFGGLTPNELLLLILKCPMKEPFYENR